MKLSLEVSGILDFCGYFVIIFYCDSAWIFWLSFQIPFSPPLYDLSLSPILMKMKHYWSCLCQYDTTGPHPNPMIKNWTPLFMKAISVEHVSYSLLNENSQVQVWFPSILSPCMKNVRKSMFSVDHREIQANPDSMNSPYRSLICSGDKPFKELQGEQENP